MKARSLLAVALTIAVSGCKVQIDVGEHGQVTSASGAHDCGSGERCVVDINDVFFDDTFAGEADPGYRFARWTIRDRGLCGGASRDCRLATTGFPGNELLMGILESDETFFLTPAFEPVGQPWSTSGTYRFETPATQLTCQDGSTIPVPARSERVRITEVGYTLRVEFLDPQTIGGFTNTQVYDAFGTADANGQLWLTRIGEALPPGAEPVRPGDDDVDDDYDELAAEILTLTGTISDRKWGGKYEMSVSFPEGNLRVCTANGRYKGNRISAGVPPISTAGLPAIGGRYELAVEASELECDAFPDMTSLPLGGTTLSVTIEQAADLFQMDLVSKLETGEVLTIAKPKPLAGWIEEDFFAGGVAVRATSTDFPGGFPLLGVFFGEISGSTLFGELSFDRIARSDPVARSCYDEFIVVGNRID